MSVLTIAVSSRALFHLEDGNEIFEKEGQAAFDTYMRSKEDVPLRPGAAFPLIRKLLNLNAERGSFKRDKVEVVLLSRNSPDAGLRIMNSVSHYGLDIERAVFSAGTDRFRYAKELGAHLFLSANPPDVAKALAQGIAAASLLPKERDQTSADDIVRIAFDGDAVLFSDEADETYRRHGLTAFRNSEVAQENVPLGAGPLKNFFGELKALQVKLGNDGRLRLALVTARGMPAHARPLKTLRSWGLHIDEAVFAGGLPKGPLLQAFGADMFFDDAQKNIESANSSDITSGHVPYGAGSGIFSQEIAAATALTPALAEA
jgi:5'-nucleotidase